jgi:DNA-binding Xre family transcriptional regulator
MKRAPTYSWQLRQVMAAHGLWKTSDLGPLLAERGVVLSPSQVYRLTAQVPERLSLRTLAALCGIFSCTPDDLIQIGPPPPKPKVDQPEGTVVDLASVGRPRRARITPNPQ